MNKVYESYIIILRWVIIMYNNYVRNKQDNKKR